MRHNPEKVGNARVAPTLSNLPEFEVHFVAVEVDTIYLRQGPL